MIRLCAVLICALLAALPAPARGARSSASSAGHSHSVGARGRSSRTKCTRCVRDRRGRIKRDSAAKRAALSSATRRATSTALPGGTGNTAAGSYSSSNRSNGAWATRWPGGLDRLKLNTIIGRNPTPRERSGIGRRFNSCCLHNSLYQLGSVRERRTCAPHTARHRCGAVCLRNPGLVRHHHLYERVCCAFGISN